MMLFGRFAHRQAQTIHMYKQATSAARQRRGTLSRVRGKEINMAKAKKCTSVGAALTHVVDVQYAVDGLPLNQNDAILGDESVR